MPQKNTRKKRYPLLGKILQGVPAKSDDGVKATPTINPNITTEFQDGLRFTVLH